MKLYIINSYLILNFVTNALKLLQIDSNVSIMYLKNSIAFKQFNQLLKFIIHAWMDVAAV